MTRCRVEQDELDFDLGRGQWAVESLFDFAEPVAELEPEPLKRPGKWVKGPGGFESYITKEEK